MERIYLTDKDILVSEENTLVTLRLADGTVFGHIEPRLLFPVTFPSSYITFLDEQGTEVAVARSLDDLSKDAKAAVKHCLDEYYLVPKITKLLSTQTKFGKVHWEVETDHGPRGFDIRSRIHDIRTLPDGRIRVRDANDNRYMIESVDALDAHSRSLLIMDL